MNCPVCNHHLHLDEVDDRQEWCRYEYHCEACGNASSRRVTYKCQSSMVESDEWEISDEKLEQLQDEYEELRNMKEPPKEA